MNLGPIIKTFLKTSKGKVIAASSGTAVAVGIGAAVLLQGGGYRSIAVEAVTGIVNVIGERNNGEAYVGENLYSGDDISVLDASELTMCMDGDKYVYADANTHFTLEASDKSEDSRIKIHLDAGSELNVLENKLGANESYEVDTPNSTMSVRGTKFRVTVYKSSDGLIYTLMEVEEGKVLVRLKTTDGSYNGVEQLFTPGQSAFIRGNSSFSEFVMTTMLDSADIENSDDDSNKLSLAYDNLPEDGMERLIALLDKMDQPKPEEPEEELVEEEPEEEELEEEEEPEEELEEEEPALDVPLADTQSVFEQMYDAAVTGTDPETGYLILDDGTLFDPDYYARNNPDVVDEFGSNPEDLLAHYLIFGKNENRAPSEQAAKNKEEEFKAFSKMLEEDAAAKKKASEEAENLKNAPKTDTDDDDDDDSSGTKTAKATPALGTPGNPYIVPASTTVSFDATTGGSTTPVTSTNTAANSAKIYPAQITTGGATAIRIGTATKLTLPLYVTDTSNVALGGNPVTSNIEYLNQVYFHDSADGVAVTSGAGYTARRNSSNSYTLLDQNGATIYTDTDGYSFRTYLINNNY